MAALADKIHILYHYLIAKRRSKQLISESDVLKFQTKRLKEHVTFLKKKSPFYSELLSSQDTLESCPVIQKKDMMLHFNSLNTAGLSLDDVMDLAIKSEKSRDFSPMIGDISVGLSSGTSGHRGVFLANRSERHEWAGNILAKCLPSSILNHHRIALFLRANNQLYESLGSNKISFTFFDAYQPMTTHVAAFNQLNPTVLTGPPSLLCDLAHEKQHNRLKTAALSVIYSSAEVLEDDMETYLKETFGVPVRQIYQCTEGFLGVSCEFGTIHLNEDNLIIEEDPIDDVRFHPIITDIRRKTQPIVRYLLNDILHKKTDRCPCGSPYKGITKIEGRSDDILFLPSQSEKNPVKIYPDFIRRAMITADTYFKDYQVIQTTERTLTIQVFVGEKTKQTDIISKQIQQSFCALFDQLNISSDVHLDIQFEHSKPLHSADKKLRRIQNQV